MDERAKNMLWDTLMTYFSLPEHLSDAQGEKVKKYALKKMAAQFYNWKKTLWSDFGKQDKTSEFTRQYKKLKDH